MTPADYAAALSRTRMQPEGRGTQGARLVLCDGLSNSEASRRVGTTPDAIRQAVARIQRAYHEMLGLPPGWLCLTVAVPPEREGALRDAVVALGGRVGL